MAAFWRLQALTGRPTGSLRARFHGWHRMIGLWAAFVAVPLADASVLLAFELEIEAAIATDPATSAALPVATRIGPVRALVVELERHSAPRCRCSRCRRRRSPGTGSACAGRTTCRAIGVTTTLCSSARRTTGQTAGDVRRRLAGAHGRARTAASPCALLGARSEAGAASAPHEAGFVSTQRPERAASLLGSRA